MSAPKQVLIVLTNHSELGNTGRKTGFYLSEASHPHKVFTDAGFVVDFVSPLGGKAPMDAADRKDTINAEFLADATLVARTQSTLRPADIDPARYAAIFYAGGHGAMWDFPDDVPLASLAARIYDHGGVVAAVCHGPAGLVNVKLEGGKYLVAGKNVNSFTNAEEAAVELTDVVPFLLESKLAERGGKFQKASNFEKKVVISERLVTGQNPASATGVAEAVVNLLNR